MFRSRLAQQESLPAWPAERSILDAFPPAMPIKNIVELLSSVGFSSPPAWRRPFQALSTGEQFRVSLARLLAFCPDLAVVDEYTSVVDRTVAQIGSAALAKTVRRRPQQFVAVTCHEDVEEWLQPDWTYRPATNTFAWRLLQCRPPIELVIGRVARSAWLLFQPHHYLSHSLAPASICFAAWWRRSAGRLFRVAAYAVARGRQTRTPHRHPARLSGSRHRPPPVGFLCRPVASTGLPYDQHDDAPGIHCRTLSILAVANDSPAFAGA